MSEKIAKTICRFAHERGYDYLRLERQGGGLICACGHGHGTDFLRLDEKTESSVAETFRRLVGAADNDLFSDKRFKIADRRSVISGRATLLPAADGEKLLITLSSERPSIRRLSALGLERDQQSVLKSSLKKKSGIILIAAGDENGASSTYYSLLAASASGKSAYSLESFPIQDIEGINTINPKKYGSIEASIDRLLKTDSELIGIDADISADAWKSIWRASGTGRLVIATLPARNAAEAINALKKAGLTAAEIASQIILISAQKLFPRPCPKCLASQESSAHARQIIAKRWPIALKKWPKRSFHSRGCDACQKKAVGKTAVFEQMRFLPDGRLQSGYEPLVIGALKKAALGLITIEDIADWAVAEKKI